MDGRLALGEALSELKLAAALNVSRTPVRDALTALQLQGLIDVRPQSGSFVFMPSEEDVAELAEFRRVMELTALRFCFARRRDEALRQMRALPTRWSGPGMRTIASASPGPTPRSTRPSPRTARTSTWSPPIA